MNEIVAAVEAEQRELTELLRGLTEPEWALPSACAGWTVADVVTHLAQTNELAIASATHAFPAVAASPAAGAIDEGADLAVTRERGTPPGALLDRWERSARELCAALRACDPSERLEWVAGSLAARTLATTRLAETWIHAGDVRAAFGGGPTPTDRLWHVARLAHRTLPYAFASQGQSMSGPVAFRLVGPSGDAWEFGDDDAPTTIRGRAYDLCRVASRRVPASATSLEGHGPDAAAVLELVRTWA